MADGGWLNGDQIMECREEGDARGVGAERTFAKAEGLKTSVEKMREFVGRPTAVGADGEEG